MSLEVLFFTHHLCAGGAEKTVRTLADYMNGDPELRRKVHVTVCVVYDDPESRATMKSEVIVMKNASAASDGKAAKAANVLRQMRELRQIKRERHIDVCVSFLPGADFLNVHSDAGEKRIVSVRNKESLFTWGLPKKLYVEDAYRHADRLVAVTEIVRQDCISYFHVPPEKVVTIHNAAPSPSLGSGADAAFLSFAEGRFVVMTVGRLHPTKGQDHLLRAFASAFGGKEQYGLALIGGGEEEERLRAMADGLDISGQVYFAGFQPHPTDFLEHADLFVLPSNVEGMPNAVIEAMQAGVPVIATECGAREILSPDTDPLVQITDRADYAPYGVLVPVCDAGDETGREQIMADAMQNLAQDAALRQRYRDSAGERLKDFDIGRICRRWIEVFERV